MEEEETEKVSDMVAPKPSIVPRNMQLGSGAPASSSKGDKGAAAAVAAGVRKSEVVYTPASDALLEVRRASRSDIFCFVLFYLDLIDRRPC